MISVRAGGE